LILPDIGGQTKTTPAATSFVLDYFNRVNPH